MNDATAVTGTTPADALTRLERHPSRAVRDDARILRRELESTALRAGLNKPAWSYSPEGCACEVGDVCGGCA